MSEPIKVFVAKNCQPCKEIEELLTKGQFLVDGEEGKADLIDIETEEGFPRIAEVGLISVPAAYRGKNKCNLRIDDETQTLLIECQPGTSDYGENQAT